MIGRAQVNKQFGETASVDSMTPVYLGKYSPLAFTSSQYLPSRWGGVVQWVAVSADYHYSLHNMDRSSTSFRESLAQVHPNHLWICSCFVPVSVPLATSEVQDMRPGSTMHLNKLTTSACMRIP